MKINGINHPNAIMRVVHVTQDDIDNGLACNCIACPLALAINRVTNVIYAVGVLTYWPIGKGHTEFAWKLPNKAMQFRRAFDNDLPVSPFSFQIPVLTEI